MYGIGDLSLSCRLVKDARVPRVGSEPQRRQLPGDLIVPEPGGFRALSSLIMSPPGSGTMRSPGS